MSTFPAQPKPPILRDMSPAEMEQVLKAHNWAYICIVAALKRVENTTDPADDDYAAWLESKAGSTSRADWEGRRKTVIDALGKMATRMSTVPVVYKKSTDPVKCKREGFYDKLVNQRDAFTELGTKDIGLCPKTFDDDYLRLFYQDSPDWARAFILVHETYHAAVDTEKTADVADSHYTWIRCRMLAYWDPALAVRNAQNYAYFVMGSLWSRSGSPPEWTPDYGIWNEPTPGGIWGNAVDGPLAAAMTHAQNTVMVAYREHDKDGGWLRYRMMLVKDGRETWLEPMLFRMSQANGETTSVRVTTAALAAWGQEFHLAYVDHENGKLLHARSRADQAMSSGNWSDLSWGSDRVTPEEVKDAHPSRTAGPALAVYRPQDDRVLNQSAGIYCMYTDVGGTLKCAARLDGGPGHWIDVKLDRRRETLVTPALAEIDGKLRCVYFDGTTSKFVMLTCEPVTSSPMFRDSKAGTWREETKSSLSMDSETIALGVWNTASGAVLVATGNKMGNRDGALRYAMYCEGKGWTEDVRTTSLASSHCPALAGCGSNLYLFYCSADGNIHSRVAR